MKYSTDKDTKKQSADDSINLGRPIPDLPHAVSVSLPKWRDIIGYEESDPRVISQMQSGYPRFYFHKKILEFVELYSTKQYSTNNDNKFLPFLSKKSAERCRSFVKNNGFACEIAMYQGVYMVVYGSEATTIIKDFWQHSGLGVSSRLAEDLIGNSNAVFEPLSGKKAKQLKYNLESKIANERKCDAEDVYIFPSGMASIYFIHEAFLAISQGLKTIQLGFPYTDTIKIQEKFGFGYHMLHYNDFSKLDNILATEKISGIFTEFPTNPLLNSPDLTRLQEASIKAGIFLTIDDTVGTSFNADILKYCDIINSSLTKFFSGKGNVMAGVAILNKSSNQYNKLKQYFTDNYEYLLYKKDAEILLKNSKDFTDRMRIINENGLRLAKFLKAHPKIKEVYYPYFENKNIYDKFKSDQGGYGGLISLILKDESKTPQFYDSLDLDKGPSFGNIFSLVCPYTMLVHYKEIKLAESYEVSKNLIRISVGIEDFERVILKEFTKKLSII